MIYPQCYSGYTTPFISFQGFLQPCCKLNMMFPKIISIDKTYIDNPFYSDEFSLYKKSFSEIIESDAWETLINSLKHTRISQCWKHCSLNSSPINSPFSSYDPNQPYVEKKVFLRNATSLQIETCNRCSLNCRYCSRYGTEKQHLNSIDLQLSVLENAFKYKEWEYIIDWGSYNDAVFYKQYHEMLELLDRFVVRNYKTSIAATGKTKKWWEKTHSLWKYLNNSGVNVTIIWCLDGLKPTSHIHRENQDWNEIFDNMVIASKNGVGCIWQFIPFSYNEHQIDEAKAIATDIGVNFYLKRSDRFRDADPLKPHNKNMYYDVEIKNHVKMIKN